VKSFAKAANKCYDAELAVYLAFRGNINSIPRLYKFQSNTRSLVLEQTGENCKKHEFSFQDFIDVCKIVQLLHSKDIVHNDLKPSNITMRKRSAALCNQAGSSGASNKNTSTSLNENEFFIIDFECYSANGKPATGFTNGYQAPERCKGLKLSYYASDVYSLGMIFAHAVSSIDKTVNSSVTNSYTLLFCGS